MPQQLWLKENPWYNDLPEYAEVAKPIRCPTHDRNGNPLGKDDIPGCGSTNVAYAGDVYDCHDCGIFFSCYAANPPHKCRTDHDYDDDGELKASQIEQDDPIFILDHDHSMDY